nr:hypothetical protein [Kofleriaceae bacterium]
MNEDLGRVVSVHRKPWRGNVFATLFLLAIAGFVLWLLGTEAMWLSAFYVTLPIIFVVAVVGARRTRVVVREDGFEWYHSGVCQRLRWNEIRGIEHRPSMANVMFLAIDADHQPQLVLPALLRDFRSLREAVENRRPTMQPLPVAKLRVRA